MGTSAFEILVVPIVWGTLGSGITAAAIIGATYALAGLVDHAGSPGRAEENRFERGDEVPDGVGR
jgi:hypothetical protein